MFATSKGPDGKWFAVGLGGLSMSDQPYTIVVDGHGNLEERKIGDHLGGRLLNKSVTVLSNKVVNGRRIVVAKRPFLGNSSDHYTFAPDSSSGIEMIMASGVGPELSYHGPDKTSGGKILLAAIGASICVCRDGWKGDK